MQMRKIVLLLLIILSFKTIQAQSTWFWQQPLPTGNFLYSVDFANEMTGYASGTVGTVMKSTDGGSSWSLKNINTTGYLTSVSAADENTVLASRNNIYRSSNGGESWTEVYSYTGNVSFFLDFPTKNTGYAAGAIGVILKTTNSGINWINQTSPVSQAFYDISFSDSLHGIISTYRGVITTTDGGINWTYVNFNLESFDLVASCSQTDNHNLFAITSFDYFFRSTNGGLNWTSSLLPVDFSNIPRQCSFSDSTRGFIVTSWGNILRTTDAGNNWVADSTFLPEYYKINVLRGVQAFNNNIVYVCGAGGKVGKSTNGGINWTSSTDAAIDLISNYFINEITGYTVGYDGLILKTTNGGNNWIQQKSNTIQNLKDVIFVNEDVGYVCGDTGTVLKTTDGGSNWEVRTSGFNDNNIKLFFTDLNTGYIVGRNASIIKTINGGSNWKKQNSLPFDEFNSLYFFNSNTGFICTNSSIRKTTDGGSNWVQITNVGGYDITFKDTLTGYACGVGGRIRKTTDGGFDWVNQASNLSGTLVSVSFIDKNNGFVTGGEGEIAKTTNGGINWIIQNSMTLNGLTSIFIINNNTGYICGEFGSLLKTTNAGLTFVNTGNTIIPTQYILEQNYPNPFNSSTIIKYELKNSTNVNIKLYNIEGKEIRTLLNKNQNAGSYEIMFNASEITSGVYFYSFEIENVLIETRKLLLIK